MKIFCAPRNCLSSSMSDGLNIMLYGRRSEGNTGSTGAAVREVVLNCKLQPSLRAWDLLSIALSVVATDMCVQRNASPDGWTRQLELRIAVSDPDFWAAKSDLLVQQLRFLTTDIWNIEFVKGDSYFMPQTLFGKPDQDCVVLFSGGLDSLVGVLDLVNKNKNPFLVSQVSRGDKQTQKLFASKIGAGLEHIQFNHNAKYPGKREFSQRARSIIFLAYGVLVATSLECYKKSEYITLYICENGFISINPPLTDLRLGSLSTRTTHPFYIKLFQQLLDEADIRVQLLNPYQFKTKGEMLKNCTDQSFLHEYAHQSTSCGRYMRNGYMHCGRCFPCLIRRAAFHKWKIPDDSCYIYEDLSIDDKNHVCYDDVRAAAMAVITAKTEGISSWAGTSLTFNQLDGNIELYKRVVERGIRELGAFLETAGVK